jgi:hypothetical protein
MMGVAPLDRMETISATAARHLLAAEALSLHHADQQTVLDCVAVIDRIDVLIQSA